ncbi:MAG: hypothetical protein M3Q07_20705, partial [Pseudobdellovibrionaceae bacterium]|nr:hypothetical protein [Pseudobdellovibrionaceae bacterium]
ATTIAGEVASTMNMAYPGALALAVFPTETGSALRLADEVAPETLAAKAAEAESYLDGTAATCLPPVFLRPAKQVDETCYEFDQEMIVGKQNSLYGTADGKSKVTGSTEACLVSFARAQIKEIENLIDMGLGLQQGMICQAVKDDVDVAAAETEEGVDLKETLDDAMDSSTDARKPEITVSEATMSKEVDADGKDIFKVSIVISMKNEKGTFAQKYSLSHAPDSDDNTAYHGVMTLTRATTAAALQNPGPAPSQSSKTHIISVTYNKTTEDSKNVINAELRSARFHADLATLATGDDGVVNYNVNADFTVASTDTNYGKYKNPTTSQYFQQVNDAVDGMLFVGYSMNVDDNTGKFEYWQNPGGNYTEAARGMVFAIEKDDAGLHGCGMSGAVLGTTNPMADSVSIRRSIKESISLSPNGFFHPFFASGKDAGGTPKVYYKDVNNNNVKETTEAYWTVPSLTDATKASTWANSQHGNLVSRQCVRQDATTGEYRIDTTKITEAAGFDLFNPTSSPDFVIAKPERPPVPPAPAK